jgi:hypothetical protein
VFDTTRLRTGEMVAAVGSILLFVFMFFFSWYGVGGPVGNLAESFGVKASVDGWNGHSILRWLMLATIVVGLGLAFLTATQRTVALPVTAAVLTTTVAGITAILLAYRVILNEPGPNELIDVKIGAWLGLLSTALVAYGGYLAMRNEGTSLGDVADQARAALDNAAPGADGNGGSAAPPPPPAADPAPPAATEEQTAFGEPLAGARPGIDEHPPGDPAVGSSSGPPPDETP